MPLEEVEHERTTDNVATITWEEFVEEFHWYHVLEGTMELKVDEFRRLKQGNMSVNEYIRKFVELSRYAPEEVSTDKKKQNRFKKGLESNLKAQLTPHIYPDFNTLMNMTILTEEANTELNQDKKRKFAALRAQQQDRFQRSKRPVYSGQKTQSTMQYRTQASSSQQPNLSYHSQNNTRTQQNSGSQVLSNNKAFFNCGDTDTSLPIAPAKPSKQYLFSSTQ